ncbi:MAG TPA: molybdopterin-dependent oxidoreductase, partial [Gemmatimonadales bacterium]|nr:molybdopterin-dependent oxidoreductase [Gemmatimonadales bacterium]
RASLESLAWLRRLVEHRQVSAAIRVPRGDTAPLEGIPDLALREERVPNLDVNRHFICDTGRADYRWMNRGDRAEVPLKRDGQRMAPVDWDAAAAELAALAQGNGPVVLLASGRASLESLAWLRRLVEHRQVSAAIRVPRGDTAPLEGIPDLALREERVPNLDGARLAGYDASWNDALAGAESASLVILLDVELEDGELSRVGKSAALVALTTLDDDRLKGAALLLPVTSMAEEHGSYVNRSQRVQRYLQAKAAPGMARPAWWVAAEAWALAGTGRSAPETAAAAFARLAESIPALGGMAYGDLGLTGRVLEPAAARSAAR